MRNTKQKTITAFILIFLSCIQPVTAQEKTDTAYLFRFVPEKDMFYVPWHDNDKELARLYKCVEQYKTEILDGKLPLWVDGYCNSMQDYKENLNMAFIRANRVKSELITRKGLTERCFITHNHASDGDFVTVRLVVPITTVPTIKEQEEQNTDTVTRQSEEQTTASVQDTVTVSPNLQGKQEGYIPETLQKTGKEYALSLRANLLRWATLTPDLGIEWRICPSWSIMVNGSWTSWSWNGKDRRYALWEVAPEVRHYIGKRKRGYIGAMFKTGEFNYKLSDTGKQGDLTGGGITGGYQLRLNDALSMDFSLGIGYLNADYEKYKVIDGVRVRQGKESKDWWGPVNAGVTLVWKIGASRAHKSSLLNAEAQPDLWKLF